MLYIGTHPSYTGRNLCVCLGGELLSMLLWVGSNTRAWKTTGCFCLLNEGRKLTDVVIWWDGVPPVLLVVLLLEKVLLTGGLDYIKLHPVATVQKQLSRLCRVLYL